MFLRFRIQSSFPIFNYFSNLSPDKHKPLKIKSNNHNKAIVLNYWINLIINLAKIIFHSNRFPKLLPKEGKKKESGVPATQGS